MNPKLKIRICEYLDYFEDENYWRQVLEEFDTSTITTTIMAMLASRSDSDVSDACLFLRDLVLVASKSEPQKTFMACYYGSETTTLLESLLRAPSLSKRMEAVYTLGKTCSRSSSKIIRAVLEESKDSDPIFLPKIAFEAQWLNNEGFTAWYYQTVFSSSSWLTRWAGLELINSTTWDSGSEDFASTIELLKVMQQDDEPFVASSAKYLLNMQKGQRPMFFEDLALRFRNHLALDDLNNYKVDELAKFAENFRVVS